MGTILKIWRVGMIVVAVAAAINRFAGRRDKALRPRNDRAEGPATQPVDAGPAATGTVQRGESPIR